MKYLWLLFIPSLSFANVFAQWGVTSSKRETPDQTSIKFVEFGLAGQEGKAAYSVGVGGWSDTSGYQTKTHGATYTAHSSAFAEGLIGVEPHSEHFYMGYKIGLAIITNPDAMLGSNAEVGHEFGFGMRDLRDVRVGLVIKHFSNAGLVKPNLGRDFCGMRIEF